VGDGTLEIHEVHRFTNEPVTLSEGFFWDYPSLQREISNGLSALAEFADTSGLPVTSLGIDTWAVDYGLVDAEGKLIAQPRHYRDERNQMGAALVDNQVPSQEQFEHNGLQFQPFNTINQLAANFAQQPQHLVAAHAMLLMPDLITHWLTGQSFTERTNASTTGLLNARTHEWDWDLIDRLGFPRRIFTKLVDAGAVIGALLPEHVNHPALSNTVVTAVATHDTASAVVGSPIDEGSAYLSSGTWSLLGLEQETPILSLAARQQNFTNELGIGDLGGKPRIRFLKNLSGLWLLQQSLADFKTNGEQSDLPILLDQASRINSPARIDVNDPVFLTPGDMPGKIRSNLLRRGFDRPSNGVQIVRVILDSLADAYADAVRGFEAVTGTKIQRLNVVGGGSQNQLLCQLTANTTGLKVVAGPVEATALGNLMTQAGVHGAGPVTLSEQRSFISQIFNPTIYLPAE
jgi:rhamnulokinase